LSVKKNSCVWAVLSGIVCGLGYLVKVTAVPIVVLFVFSALLFRVNKKLLLYFILSFLSIILLESVYYYLVFGRPFISWKVPSTANTCIYRHESPPRVVFENSFFRIENAQGWWYLCKQLWFIPLLIFFLCGCFVVPSFLCVFIVLGYLYFEFGCVGLEWSDKLSYWLIYKQMRYFLAISVPLMAVAGCSIHIIKKSKIVLVPLVITTLVLFYIGVSTDYKVLMKWKAKMKQPQWNTIVGNKQYDNDEAISMDCFC
jgi:hypothetical protein